MLFQISVYVPASHVETAGIAMTEGTITRAHVQKGFLGYIVNTVSSKAKFYMWDMQECLWRGFSHTAACEIITFFLYTQLEFRWYCILYYTMASYSNKST